MKNQPIPSPTRSGFTLIELLVVIAIIVILAAMGFGAGMAAINKAKKASALNDCTNLVMAVQAYYDDYSSLPEVEEAESAPGARTDEQIMNILLGFDEEQNPKKTRYFNGREAKGTSLSRAYNGIFYSDQGSQISAELFDPWRKTTGTASQNRHYYIMLDTLGYGEGTAIEEVLKDPFSNRPLYGRLAVAWSTGKDGLFSLGSESDDLNRDNVYSWK